MFAEPKSVENEKSIRLSHQRLPDLVTERLSDWIMDGKLQMGQKLTAEELAERLGVSRMPVRESLKNLEKLGVVESIPYVGTRIVKLSKSDVAEIYLIRQSLEPIAAFHACEKISPEQIRVIEDIHLDFSLHMQQPSPDPKRIHLLNRSFHFAIYSASGLTRLCQIIENSWNNLSFFKLIYGRTYVSDPDKARHMIEEHQSYIDFLKNHDSEGIQQALFNSLNYHRQDVPRQVSSHMDYEIEE